MLVSIVRSKAMKVRTKMRLLMEEEENCSINEPAPAPPPPQVLLRLLSSALETRIRKSKILLITSTTMRKMMMMMMMMKSSSSNAVITVFDGSEVPAGLSTQQYLERIYKYCNCTNSCVFVLAYVYMDRFLTKTGTCLTYLNLHRLLITALMLAAKFTHTLADNNAHFAKVGGISTAEMNRLEIEFLFRVDFRLHASPDLFRKYCAKLDEEATMKTTYPIGNGSCSSSYTNLPYWTNKNCGYSIHSPATPAIHYDDDDDDEKCN